MQRHKGLRRWATRLAGLTLLAATILLALDGPAVKNHLAIGPQGDELLLLSAANKDLPGVLRALDEGADIEARSAIGSTPLIFACSSGDAAVVQALLDRGAKPSAGTPLLKPMHFAIINGNVRVVELLLERGVDPNEMTCDQSYVDLAEQFEYPLIVKALVAHGAKPPNAVALR